MSTSQSRSQLREIFEKTPSLNNDILNDILMMFTFEDIIKELVNYPFLYDHIANRQEFWKSLYYERFLNKDDVFTIKRDTENTNWFYKMFTKLQYYYAGSNKDNLKLLRLPDPEDKSDKDIISNVYKDKLTLKYDDIDIFSNVKQIVVNNNIIHYIVVLQNNGDLYIIDLQSTYRINDMVFNSTNIKDSLTGERIKKIINFNVERNIFSYFNVLIILTEKGSLFQYDIESHFLERLNTDYICSDIKKVIYTSRCFTTLDNNNILRICYISNKNSSLGREVTDVQLQINLFTNIYSIIEIQPNFNRTGEKSSFLLFYIVNNTYIDKNSTSSKYTLKIDYIEEYTLKYDTFEIPLSLDIIDMNIIFITMLGHFLQLIDINNEVYWFYIGDLDVKNYSYIVGKLNELSKDLTQESDLNKLDFPNKILSVKQTQLGVIIMDEMHNLYSSIDRKSKKDYSNRTVFKSSVLGIKYLKHAILHLNDIFILDSEPINDAILEVYNNKILIHNEHFLLNTLRKNVEIESWDDRRKTVKYGLKNDINVFETTFP